MAVHKEYIKYWELSGKKNPGSLIGLVHSLQQGWTRTFFTQWNIFQAIFQNIRIDTSYFLSSNGKFSTVTWCTNHIGLVKKSTHTHNLVNSLVAIIFSLLIFSLLVIVNFRPVIGLAKAQIVAHFSNEISKMSNKWRWRVKRLPDTEIWRCIPFCKQAFLSRIHFRPFSHQHLIFFPVQEEMIETFFGSLVDMNCVPFAVVVLCQAQRHQSCQKDEISWGIKVLLVAFAGLLS